MINNITIMSCSSDQVYIGNYPAFAASGGYKAEQGLQSITLLRGDQINTYDVTQAIQVVYDVRSFNKKLGITKDVSNLDVLSTTYDPATNRYTTDSITINALEFVEGVPKENIMSVGKLSTLYSDFIEFISDYFDYPQGFSSLFTITSQYDINNGIFDISALHNLFSAKAFSDGQYIRELSGNIVMSGISNLMDTVVYNDSFGNRDRNGNANTASDPYDRNNYTLADGFLQDDLIYIPYGFEVKLTLSVINNNVLVNYLGYQNAENVSNDYHNSTFQQSTDVCDTNISRIVKCPMLIRLKNISTGEGFPPGTTMSFTTDISVFASEYPVNEISIDTVLNTTASIIELDPSYITFTEQSDETERNVRSVSTSTLSDIYSLSKTLPQTRDLIYTVKLTFTIEINLDTFVTSYNTVQELYNSFQNDLAQSISNNAFTDLLLYNVNQNTAVQLYDTSVVSAQASNLTSSENGPEGPQGVQGPTGTTGAIGSTGSAGPSRDNWTSNAGSITTSTAGSKVLIGKTAASNVSNIMEISGNALFKTRADISGTLLTNDVIVQSGNVVINNIIDVNTLSVGKSNDSTTAVDVSGSMHMAQLYLSKFELPVSYSLADITSDSVLANYTQGSVYYVNMALVESTVLIMPFTCIIQDIDTASVGGSQNIPFTLILDYTQVDGAQRNFCNTLHIENAGVDLSVYFSGGEPTNMSSSTRYLIQDFKILYRRGEYKHSVCTIRTVDT
jgi:hypothetical protein